MTRKLTKKFHKTLALFLTLTLALSLFAGLGGTASATAPATNPPAPYHLAWGTSVRIGTSAASNPVAVEMLNSATPGFFTLSVTYTNSSNYFNFRNGDWGPFEEPQGTEVYRQNAAGNYERLSDVVTKIQTASIPENDHARSVGILFRTRYTGADPTRWYGDNFIFADGNYGILFDIVTNGYHHATGSGSGAGQGMYLFTVSGGRVTSQGASGTATTPGSGGGLNEGTLDMILDSAGAGSGQITVSLTWATNDDLDLHMITPAGNEIMYNRKTADGGTLDVDMTQSSPVANPVENIFFPAPSPGTYRVKLVNYSDRTSGTSTEYLIRVTVGAATRTFTGTIDGSGTARDIVEFTIRTAADGTVTGSDLTGPGTGGGLTEDSLDLILDGVNAGSGQITVSLTWATNDDLDLHMITPAGNEIMYNRKTADGGTLDVDMTQSSPVANPVENIFFPAPSPGTYRVKLVNYSDRTSGTSTEYLIRVTVGTSSRTFTGTIDGSGTARDIVEFTIRTAADGTVTGSDLTGGGGAGADPISSEVGPVFNLPGLTHGIGWRIFRSTQSGQQGIDLTDFAIQSTDFIDVNVNPNTTYYYSLYEVVAEADPFSGRYEDTLSPVVRQWTVTTPNEIIGGGGDTPGRNRFIVMTIGSPNMTVDGVVSEIDPGRGTVATIINDRTMIPIRAISEAIGGPGVVGWDGATQTLTINLNGRELRMTIGSRIPYINGVAGEEMVMAPTIVNERTLIPIRAFELLGYRVSYVTSTRQVVVVFTR